MDKHSIAVLAAAASGLLMVAGAAAASEKAHARAIPCSDKDYIKVNVSPPPPLAGSVQTDDIGKLLGDFAAGKVPLATPSPTPTPRSEGQELIDRLKKACANHTPAKTIGPSQAMELLGEIFGD